MRFLSQIGGVVGLALGLSACSTLYTVDVAAYNNADADLDNTYVLLSGSPNLNINSPEFSEFASQVERALAPMGLRRVTGDDLSAVALGIYIAADVGEAKKRYHSVTTPLVESTYSEDAVAGTRSEIQSGGGGNSQTQGNTPLLPPPADERIDPHVGYERTAFATVVYTKYLNLMAVDLQKYLRDLSSAGQSGAVPREIWSVDIESTGQPGTLIEAFPVMIAAGQPYLTGTTDEVVRVKISATDKRVNAIKGSQ